MQSLHWQPRPLGLPSKYPEGTAVGVAIEISDETLDRLRATHGIEGAVLDEPFEAVDPVSSASILEILSAYVAHGGTVVLSSHGMDLVESVCSRVAVVVGGQVIAEGSVDEVKGEISLEQRFVELSGAAGSMEGLEWLHTSSD